MRRQSLVLASLSCAAGLAWASGERVWSALSRPEASTNDDAAIEAGIDRGPYLLAELERVLLTDAEPVVLVRPRGRAQVLPIWIRSGEARALTHAQSKLRASTPTTVNLLCETIAALDARVLEVRIEPVSSDGSYPATVVLERAQTLLELRARPADALAPALEAGAEVYVASANEPHMLTTAAPPTRD